MNKQSIKNKTRPKPRKLKLSKQTLRDLTPGKMDSVKGGVASARRYCVPGGGG